MRAKPWEVPDGLRLRDDGLAQAAHLAAGRECGKLHELLLAELHAADQLEWERAVADSSHPQVKRGAPRQVRARPTGAVAVAAWVRGHDAADRGADQDPPRARAGGGARGGKGGGPDREVGHRRQEDLTPSLTSTVRVLPPRRTVSFTVSPGLCASISARSCWDVVTFVPLNTVMTSPPVG